MAARPVPDLLAYLQNETELTRSTLVADPEGVRPARTSSSTTRSASWMPWPRSSSMNCTACW